MSRRPARDHSFSRVRAVRVLRGYQILCAIRTRNVGVHSQPTSSRRVSERGGVPECSRQSRRNALHLRVYATSGLLNPKAQTSRAWLSLTNRPVFLDMMQERVLQD